jgi:internalin A
MNANFQRLEKGGVEMRNARTPLNEIELEERLKTGVLSLRGFELSELPDELFELTHLVKLDLRGNKFSDLSERIQSLRQLKEIFLADNEFHVFPAVVLSLPSLEVLDVANNYIQEIPDAISALSSLHYLRIGSNPIAQLPPAIGALPQLQILLANDLRLEGFPLCVCNTASLKRLDLSYNNISEIPFEFTKLTNLRHVVLDKCAVARPPIEVLARGPGAIINYLHAFETYGDAFTLREAKLLVVGQGGVGKTFLMNRLIHDRLAAHDLTTEGIDINRWEIDTGNEIATRVNFWDFGGQEVYHSTHQFFLTRRSLYLFVWDSRREDNILNFDYWLNVIKLLSDSSPVIVVQNKVDERVKMIDEQSLKDKFPNILSFHKVSAVSGVGIKYLRSAILDAIPNLEHFGDTLPRSWHEIRQRLEAIPEPFISLATYFEICAEYGMDELRSSYLSQYFHDLGTFLHFQDNPVLNKIIFLKPEWATNAVYRLIDTKSVQEAFGKFTFAELDRIWPDYPDVRYIHLLELMKRFELCFQIRHSNSYIVPELLSASRPTFFWDDADNLHFYYCYGFMPAGIITRLIVRMQGYAQGDIYWKNGVVLVRDGAQALVVSQPLQRRILIQIRGSERHSMLAMIRRQVDQIHVSMNDPDVQEMIPCVCRACANSDTPYMHSFDYLKKAKAGQKYTVECKSSLDDVRIDSILRDVQAPKRRGSVAFDHGRKLAVRQFPDSFEVGSLLIRRHYTDDIFPLTGLTADDFDRVLWTLASMDDVTSSQFSTLIDAASKPTYDEKSVEEAKVFAERHGVAIAQNMTASAFYDLLKFLFQ